MLFVDCLSIMRLRSVLSCCGDFGPIEGYISKRCKIGGRLLLITHRKSYMSFRLVSKSVTLNDLEQRNGRYLALLHRTA